MEDDHRPTVGGSYLPCQRQRDPSTFSGDGNINPGQWLKEYERVSKYNRWDETMKLANVVFYLNGTAGRWFDNNEESLNSWRSFEDAFRGVFGLQEDSARRAEEVLKSRAQKAEESSESYIQEILSSCHQVNPRMEEGEIVAHIIKGISEDTYQVLVAKDIQTVDEILKFCRHLTTVKQRRIGRTKFARLSNVMPISCVDDSDDLAGLIRRIVREEIQKVFSAPEVVNPLREVNALEQTVREEVSRALQPTRPQVNVVQQQPRTPYYNIDRPTQLRKTEHWRTYDDKPICFHCGRPGHVVRYCRERRQVFAEARSRNGGEGRNVGFSSRPPRYDADDDYVTPQTSTPSFQPFSHASECEKLSGAASNGGEVAIEENPPGYIAAKLKENFVMVEINGRKIKALVDSGADFSVISDKFRRELKTPLFKEPGPILKAANKNLIETIGKCVLNIEVNGLKISFEFVVMVECSHDIIFGWDFFKATEVVIDCGRNELHLGETSVLESREEENQRLFASDDFVIPPKSIKKISVINEEVCGVRDVLVSTSKDLLLRKEVLIPNSLVTFRHGRGSIWVANGASWPQLIPSGMNMCTMESYENGNICSLIESSDKLQETQQKSREWSQKINLTLDPGLSEIQRLQLVSCLDEFIDIFDFGSTPIKPTSTVKHKINTGDQSPIKQRPYRVAPSERRLIQDEVNKMIENHILKPSESPWSSPVILVRKKDGTWRFCVDYRRLNKITKKDVYPLPRIDDALDSLAGSSYFSTMDLRSGYWQIEVDEKDREKTAFITPDGLYEFQVMPFGLCNAPATFERMIDSVLGSLKWNMCLCYLDDIVVYAPTFEEHLRRLQLVLSCIQKAGLSLNHKKCLFGSRRIKILGHLVDANGIHPDPDKVEAVSKFPRPRNISELKSFLGLCSYYRRFIENFADKARSLHDLLKTEKQFYWDAAQEKAFEVLKTALISEPVLGHFDESADTHLHTDASGHGIGAVLLQIQGGKERPIAYASRSLTKAENNYSTTEKECLAVVWSISKFRPYLFGRPFTVVTDHHFLCWLVGQKDPSGRLARWALKLQEFDVTVIYKSGRKHKDADCLSRSPLENDPPSAVMSLTNVDIEQTKDPDLAKIIDNLNSGYTRKEFSIIDGILYKKNYSTTGRPWLMMIPKHLRSEVMADLHDAPTAGHLGFARTYDKVKKRFYWPGLYRTVRQYTNGLTERFNKTLGDMLSMYTGVEQKDWDQVLPYVTFAYNTAKQEATGYTPFFLVHAREAETYIDAVLPYLPDEISDDYVGELVTRAEEARQLSRSRLLQSQAKDRRLYDQKHTPVYYQKDDLVWVFTPIRKVGLSEKLLKRYFGPYKVTKKLSEVTPPAREVHGTLAAARGDVTAPPTAASSSENLADPASLNWADSEMAEVDANDDYTVVKSKKRRLSSTPEHAAKQASRPAEKRGPQQQKRTTGPRSMPPQEIKATRANIADARARQATTNHENYVFVELCPDIPDYSYLKAMSTLLGGPKSITQFHRMNGHFIVGLADKELANRFVADGLEIEGTSLRVFPFRKRAERIVVANLPGFVEDSTIVTALGQFGNVTSIAPILVKMGEFTFTDGRREAFILLREGVRLETLPTRLTIHSKGDTLSAFLSFGIKCSKCGKQGHRRANCPALARQGNGSPRQAASPTDARPPLPPPQRPRKPAPAPATPASPVQPAKTSAEAQAIPSAHQPAEQMDLTHPAPAAHPASLAALLPPEPRIPPLDNEMSVEKLSSPPATPARGKAALEQLLEHLGKSPNPSIDWDKLPDLNCEEAQKLLTSETTMKRRAPTLTKEQFTALEKLHETIKALCPDFNSTIRKTLQKTRKETNAFHLGSGQDLCLGYGAVVLAHPVAISGSVLACVFGPGVAVLQQRILWPGHIALATIDVHGEKMTAIAVHLAHEPRERNQQLELLAATAAQEEEGACWIIGDFNIRDRGPSSSSSSSDALAALLDLAALVDVATQFDAAHLPTRVSMHGDQVESNRLDRILVPAGVLDRVSTYATSHYHLSDHRLVLLQVGPPTTAVSSPTQPRLAAMLRSGLALEHLAGYIRELEEDTAHDDDDGTFWDRWTSIKAGLLAEARSLHDPRHAANDSYVYRARRYIAAQLEASSIRADYPSLPDLARAIRLRRPVSVIRDEQDNIIEGPELRRRAFATFQPRFARPTSDPAAGAAFIASSAPTTTRELSEEDPLHRPDIIPSEIANAIEHLPRGKAPGWDGLPCELLVAFSEDFFAEALARVFAASRLRGALPPSTRRSSICLVPKARGGHGLDGYRPVALPSADYRVLAAILHRRLKPHLRTLVPECQTYAVPGRSPSWNIAMVTDAIEEATALGSPLAVMGVDLESAFDSLDRGFLESLLTSLRLPPAFMAWINILYAGADATIRVGGFHTTAFPLLNGLRQGCAVSAALFSIATGPLLRRLELTLGVGNVIAYADDIVLLFHRDGDFERVATVFEDYRQASGIGVNLQKSAGLWCGAWRNRGDSPLGASWSTTSIRVLGLDIAPRSTVIHREQHLLALQETACRKWTPFTRGLSLVGRARAANTLVGCRPDWRGSSGDKTTRRGFPPMSWRGQLPSEASASSTSRPSSSSPASRGCRSRSAGGRNAFSWLVGGNSGEAWFHPPPDGTRLQPRRLRLLKLWEEASNILGLNHRAVPTAKLLDLPIIGGCRFLRPPDLLAPARWRGARVRDLIVEEHLIARPTRSALADAAALGAFCRRLTSENAVGFGTESTPSSSSLAAAVVLRGTATPFLNGLTTRSARRALDRPPLAATPISRFLARWTPTINPPSRID
ncbi:hypothetical protein LAZ67_5001228 [Cordylochernes scorpioides]|uniref:RNA-directed DNA polymerase n=1 Tax=Cordylochernes scorpioides TaxID=51811 RepID=A0ABY6KFM4_9ARAC|nr:hypothetical protein LAZ67_5001228 [Cordylochernes scorpioides]